MIFYRNSSEVRWAFFFSKILLQIIQSFSRNSVRVASGIYLFFFFFFKVSPGILFFPLELHRESHRIFSMDPLGILSEFLQKFPGSLQEFLRIFYENILRIPPGNTKKFLREIVQSSSRVNFGILPEVSGALPRILSKLRREFLRSTAANAFGILPNKNLKFIQVLLRSSFGNLLGAKYTGKAS